MDSKRNTYEDLVAQNKKLKKDIKKLKQQKRSMRFLAQDNIDHNKEVTKRVKAITEKELYLMRNRLLGQI